MTSDASTRFRVAVAQAAPVLLDTTATIAKACSVIAEAARVGAQLVAFPETYVPAFPVWSALRAPIYNHDLFKQLANEAIVWASPELDKIAKSARSHDILVSLGFNERSPASVGCLFNSNVLIDERGRTLNHHRKIMPTFYEKLTWAAGDGAGLRVCPTRCGRIGMLICGENTNPLARYTLMADGEQVHISSYPPVWPTHDPSKAENYPLAEAIRLRAGAHSFEAKAFNLVAAGFLDQAAFDFLAGLHPDAQRILEGSPRGVSLVTGPSGRVLAEADPEAETLLYADIDLSECVEPKQWHDVSGGYNRFDIFRLSVDRSPRRPAWFAGDEGDSTAEPRGEANDAANGGNHGDA